MWVKDLFKDANLEIEISASDLDQPVSVTQDGDIATLKDLIAAHGNDELRKRFNIPNNTVSVKSVTGMSKDELKKLTQAVISKESPGSKLCIGRENFSLDEFDKEISNNTSYGEQFINAVREHSLFLEKAVREGRLVLKSADSRPKLPF